MAIRCGAYSNAPSITDLAPGAKTLYTTDGQAVTIVAVHADSGESFFIVGVVGLRYSGVLWAGIGDSLHVGHIRWII